MNLVFVLLVNILGSEVCVGRLALQFQGASRRQQSLTNLCLWRLVRLNYFERLNFFLAEILGP